MCPRLNNQFQLISISQCSCLVTVPQICFGAVHFSTSQGKHTHSDSAGTVQGGIGSSQGQKVWLYPSSALFFHGFHIDPQQRPTVYSSNKENINSTFLNHVLFHLLWEQRARNRRSWVRELSIPLWT